MTKYAVVTCISQFRERYVIPIDDLQALNTDSPVQLDWAGDCVTCNEVQEFSQKHIGETIIDIAEMTEEEILKLFDSDNDYLKGWGREKKLEWINNWKE